jgi:hypothetical protein
MSVSAYASFGTLLKVGDGASPQSFHTITGVGNIKGPNTNVSEKETTSHSTSSPHRTYIPTLIEDGDLSFPIFYQPTDPTHSISSTYGLEYLFQNRVVRAFVLQATDPSTTSRQFNAFVKSMGENYDVDGLILRDVTIRIVTAPAVVTPVAG